MSSLPVVIVLAAGRGERFAASGGTVHKLQALLAGKRVLDHVLDAVQASGLQHHVVLPDAANPGMGDSIAAGVRATTGVAGAAGWLILPADLPLIRSDTLRKIALAPLHGPAQAPACAVVMPLYQGQRGHPVRFSAACGPELLLLKGNQGAAQIVRAQEAINSVAFIETDDPGTVTDIDTLEDLRRAEMLLRACSR
ncbi:nucleotidyltransferase family protein [Polaromonas sp. P2-4]|nr:nucleotidyltransferase family protein [Polaromonas sp. P2-4]